MQNGRWTCPHVGNPMQNGRWTCQNVANTTQNGRWTCPHIVNPMQNGRWNMPKCGKYHAKWQIQVPNRCKHLANGTSQEIQKKIPNLLQKKILKLFHTHFPLPCFICRGCMTCQWSFHSIMMNQYAVPWGSWTTQHTCVLGAGSACQTTCCFVMTCPPSATISWASLLSLS